MSVILDSRLIVPGRAPIAAVSALVRALVVQRIVRGTAVLYVGEAARRSPLTIQLRPPAPAYAGSDLDTLLALLAETDDDACVWFPEIDASHPEYAFHYEDPRECCVAVVRLREAIDHEGETTTQDDPDELPETEERIVRGATWLELEGREAPYEGELGGSYIARAVRETLGEEPEILGSSS